MAHGGSEDWNTAVKQSVAKLGPEVPMAIAFGMADPRTMAAAVDSLLNRGVDRITVVRLFLSHQSFLEATEYILGLSDSRPHSGMHEVHMRQLGIPVPVRLSREGLLDAPEMGGVLRDRALALKTPDSLSSVLFLAHGAGSEVENDGWLERMDRLADSTRATGAFTSVAVETLREDWDVPRAEAEARIRAWVMSEGELGREVIVVPVRLAGFGPYAEVLEGLEYKSDGTGLVPDDRIGDWVARQAKALSH